MERLAHARPRPAGVGAGRPPAAHAASPGGHPTAWPPELRLEEVTDGAGVAAFEQVLVDGFPLEEVRPYRRGRLFDERVLGGGFRCWVGSVNGRAVTGAAAYVSAGVTGVAWVATLPEARGRGYGAAVTSAAATCQPDRHAVLHASDLGRPVYERMGFVPLFRFTLWHRPPPG